MDWFLYDNGLRQERVNKFLIQNWLIYYLQYFGLQSSRSEVILESLLFDFQKFSVQ